MNQDGAYLSEYKERMIETMKRINPDWKKKDIEKELSKMIDENFQSPNVTLSNNYTGESRESTMISVLDWAIDNKPILSGNMTFYKDQDHAINPIGNMLRDKLAERKALKKKMYQYVDNKAMYDALDRSQGNVKRLVNSYYGASGMPSSKFYSMWSGPATTGAAQMVISTCEQMFEGYVADNYDFLNLTECLEWCNTALKDFEYLDDFIQAQGIPAVEDRLYDKILNHEDNDMRILDDYLSGLSDDEITFLYYKNNMIEFIDNHQIIQELIYDIFDHVIDLNYVNEKDENWYSNVPDEYKNKFNGKTAKDYNKFVNVMYFMDPNDPPENIMEYLDELNTYMMRYVFVNYLSFDRIYRLRNFKRRCVTVIDTDSNILSIDTIVNYIFDNVVKGETFGREFINNEFIVVNMMTYLITAAVKTILYTYSCKANICEDYRGLLAMKSEFFFKKLVIGKTKKRYISKITLREGTYINPPKYDIKGFDFGKATTSEIAQGVFEEIIKKYILCDEPVDVEAVQNEVNIFRHVIINSIRNGERTFLPNGNAKELRAYKDPGSVQSIRAALTWNLLYPDNMIEFPSKVNIIKLNIFKEEDIEDLKNDEPEIYNTIMDKIFHDTTGIFVNEKVAKMEYVNPKDKEWYKHIPKKYRTKWKKLGAKAWNEYIDELEEEYKKNPTGDNPLDFIDDSETKSKGMQIIAIPKSVDHIPEWLDRYIDYNTMVNNILAPFNPILDIIGIQTIDEGKSKNGVNRKTKALSNIIKF